MDFKSEIKCVNTTYNTKHSVVEVGDFGDRSTQQYRDDNTSGMGFILPSCSDHLWLVYTFHKNLCVVKIWATLWMSRSDTSLTANVEILGCKGNSIGLLQDMTVGIGKVCSLTSEVLASLNKGVPPPVCFDWRGWFRAGLPFFRGNDFGISALIPHGSLYRRRPLIPNLTHPEYHVTPEGSAKVLIGLSAIYKLCLMEHFVFPCTLGKRAAARVAGDDVTGTLGPRYSAVASSGNKPGDPATGRAASSYQCGKRFDPPTLLSVGTWTAVGSLLQKSLGKLPMATSVLLLRQRPTAAERSQSVK
ncbi:hypothetical protein J6590_103534 [Homalodisca vitripennis]|nr:hypothetical protein J6590_103534 [Homalodisca vitripennis]